MNNCCRSYYIDLGYKDVREGMYDMFKFDNYNIPLFSYPWGDEYNVIFICHYGLYNLYLFNIFRDEKFRDKFFDVVHWLERYGVEADEGLLFYLNFPLKTFKISSPWISAMGQGRAASVLTRAFELSNDRTYLKMAHRAIKPYFTKIEDGGVQSSFKDGSPTLEEYPSNPPSIVLNGFIIALFGFFDVIKTDPKKNEIEFYDKLILSLKNNINKFDCGFWSKYMLFKKPPIASIDYHKYHILLLWKMYELTGEKIFFDYSLKWDKNLHNPFNVFLRHSTRAFQKLFY